MKNIYLAIWYGCNQNCCGCPVARNENRSECLSVDDIREILKGMDGDGPVYVTVSGGEPTLHPEFFEILDLFMEHRVGVCILTNAERFGDRAFCDMFLRHVDLSLVEIVTTLHASCAEIHEAQNGSVGSFDASVRGLQYLSFRGVQISVKHCITAENYKDTAQFVHFIDESFHPGVDIQLWGLDYAGLTKEQADQLYLPFSEMRLFLEEALDLFMALSKNNHRRITLHNLPLCALDPFYWDFMPGCPEKDSPYEEYIDPTTHTSNVESDCGKLSARCRECAVYDYCCGAYKSLFRYFGDETVTPIHGEEVD